jgi:kynurenine formamidase
MYPPKGLVDLTRPLGPETPVLPGDPAITLVPATTHEADGYRITRVCLGSHSGTHLDAPRHFFPDGATLDAYPLDRFVGSGVILDVRPTPTAAGGSADPGLIDAELLADRLRASVHQPGGFVLLWSEGAPLTAEAARVLLDADPGLVGIDAPSLDPPPESPPGTTTSREPYPAHRLLLGSGVPVAENLCELERLGPGPVNCVFLPLALAGADGAPVRAIAWREP